MITEDYVSFETAKLLKEKGFDTRTRHYYDKDGDLLFWAWVDYAGKNEFYAPTLQMAMKWLREVHDAIINVFYDEDEDRWCAEHYRRLMDDYTLIGYGDTYEQACEAAIKYCLENFV